MVNKKELANIIQGYYGGSIDGYSYLGKFIDAEVEIKYKHDDLLLYAQNKFQNNISGKSIDHKRIADITKFFNLSLRDINQLVDFINFIQFEDNFGFIHKMDMIVFFKCLQMKRPDLYQKFMSNKGEFIGEIITALNFAIKILTNSYLATLYYLLLIVYNVVDIEEKNVSEYTNSEYNKVVSEYTKLLADPEKRSERKFIVFYEELLEYIFTIVDIYCPSNSK